MSLRIDKLDLSLSGESGERAILQAIALSLAPGERAAVLGPSGAGKTTLLRAIAGLARPSAGTIAWGAEDWFSGGRERVPPERRRVGFVFQSLALWPHMSVRETLTFGARGDRRARRRRAEGLAAEVGLGDRLDAPATALSGGERQRLALARALAQEPRLLLLDEPYGQLDGPRRRRILLDGLDRLGPEMAALLVSHNPEDARLFAERLVVLDAGRILADGSADALWRSPDSARLAELLDLGAIVEARREGEELVTPLGRIAAGQGPGQARRALLRPENIKARGDAEGAARVLGRLCFTGQEPGLVIVELGSLRLRARSEDGLRRGDRARLSLEGRARCFA